MTLVKKWWTSRRFTWWRWWPRRTRWAADRAPTSGDRTTAAPMTEATPTPRAATVLVTTAATAIPPTGWIVESNIHGYDHGMHHRLTIYYPSFKFKGRKSLKGITLTTLEYNQKVKRWVCRLNDWSGLQYADSILMINTDLHTCCCCCCCWDCCFSVRLALPLTLSDSELESLDRPESWTIGFVNSLKSIQSTRHNLLRIKISVFSCPDYP